MFSKKKQTFWVYDPFSVLLFFPAFEFKYSDLRQKTARTHVQVMCARDHKNDLVL